MLVAVVACYRSYLDRFLIASFSNDHGDGNGNENFGKAIGFR